MMKRTFLLGLCIAAIGGVGLLIAGQIGLSFQNTVLGVGAGVVAGTVAAGSPIWRLVGLVVGYFLGVLFDAMRLGLLPGGGTAAGTAVAIAIILVAVTLVAGFTAGRIPLWVMILGALAFIGGFTPIIETAPWTAAEALPTQIATLLAMAGIGFLSVVPAELLPDKKRPSQPVEPARDKPVDPGPLERADTPLSEMIGGTK